MKTFLTHALGLAMAAVLVLLAIALTACTDDAELVIPDPAKSSLPFPVTPEMLMGNVHEAYGTQDLAGYAAMLHPDFEFQRTDGAVYGRDTELRIAARMFSGEDYVKPDRTVAGIAKIEIDRFEGLGEWVPVPGGGARGPRPDLPGEAALRADRRQRAVRAREHPLRGDPRRDGRFPGRRASRLAGPAAGRRDLTAVRPG